MTKNVLCYLTWDFDPIIFKFNIFGHDFPIGLYGVLFASVFVVAQMVMSHIFKKDGKSTEDLDQLTINIVLGVIIGARLGHFLFYEWEYLFADPLNWFIRLIVPPYAGLASHGGTIGIILAIYLFKKKTRSAASLGIGQDCYCGRYWGFDKDWKFSEFRNLRHSNRFAVGRYVHG